MAVAVLKRPVSFLWLLGVLLAAVLTACSPAATPTSAPLPTATPIPTVKVSMLVQVSETDQRWFRNVVVNKGTNAYELTEKVTEGKLKSQWYPIYRSHFIESIFDVAGKGNNYWLSYVWDESEKKWTSLPVGADLYSLHDGHVLAWAYVDTAANPPKVPASTP